MSTSMKMALYGDSYISRLGNFCNYDLKVPGDVQFFGRGGMTVNKQDRTLLRQLQKFKPDVVFISLGGNDIDSKTKPADIVGYIEAMVDSFITSGAKTVYVTEICERRLFKMDPKLTKKSFNAQSRKINTMLSRINNINLVDLKMKFPKDYDADQVHFNKRGQRKFFYVVRDVLCSQKFIFKESD